MPKKTPYRLELIPTETENVHVLTDSHDNRMEWHERLGGVSPKTGELYIRNYYPLRTVDKNASAFFTALEKKVPIEHSAIPLLTSLNHYLDQSKLHAKLMHGVTFSGDEGIIESFIPQQFRSPEYQLPGFNPSSVPRPVASRERKR